MKKSTKEALVMSIIFIFAIAAVYLMAFAYQQGVLPRW